MSLRRTDVPVDNTVQVQQELEALKETALASARADAMASSAAGYQASAAFDALSPVEQSAASLGVHPDSWYEPL